MYFFVKTHNPRPTFHLDMTPEEREIMNRHVEYWKGKADQGIAIAFGPVIDPAGVYGIGIHRTKDEAEMRELLSHDPANSILKYEVLPMAQVVIGNIHGE